MTPIPPDSDTDAEPVYRVSDLAPETDQPTESVTDAAILAVEIAGSEPAAPAPDGENAEKPSDGFTEAAIGCIRDNAGTPAQTDENSLRAFFPDAQAALLAAVRILEIHSEMSGTAASRLPQIRIGLHCGDIETSATGIHGQAVHFALKLARLSPVKSIRASRSFKNRIDDVPGLRLTLTSAYEVDGETIFNIEWEREPPKKILRRGVRLRLQPIRPLADRRFVKAWAVLAENTDLFPNPADTPDPQRPFDAFTMDFEDLESATATAHRIRRALIDAVAGGEPALLPVHLFLSAIQETAEDAAPPKIDPIDPTPKDLGELIPGEIYLARSLRKFIGGASSLVLDPPPERHPSRPFYRLMDAAAESPARLFLYRSHLVQNDDEMEACFYCGARGHLSLKCLTKTMARTESGLEKLGYLTIQRINRAFFHLLCGSGDGDPETQAARQALTGLQRVFQLTTARNVWDSDQEDWEAAVRGGLRQGGGDFRLILDCIRTGNHKRAGEILDRAFKDRPEDHRLHGAAGLIAIEDRDLRRARFHFGQALGHAGTVPQKMLYRMLLSRLRALSGEAFLAQREMEEALNLAPRCREARYRYLLCDGIHREPEKALTDLEDLIAEDRTFFVRVLIDPDLTPLDGPVAELLEQILRKARETAKQTSAEAGNEVERLKRLAGGDMGPYERILKAGKEIQALAGTESYFGLLDLMEHSRSLTQTVHRAVADRKQKLFDGLQAVVRRIDEGVRVLQTFPGEASVHRLYRQLQAVHRDVDGVKNTIRNESPGVFTAVPGETAALTERLEDIFFQIKLTGKVLRVRQWLTTFLRITLVVQTLNIFAGLILFPLVTQFIIHQFPELQIPPGYISYYIKGFIMTGGVFGLILAVVITVHKQQKR